MPKTLGIWEWGCPKRGDARAPPSKTGKSALGTRLKTDITVRRTLGAGPLSVHAYPGEYVLEIVIRKNARNKFTLYLPFAILRPKGILHR